MIRNRDRYSSVISSSSPILVSSPVIIPDEDMDNITESDSSCVEWWVPENQLGLEPQPEQLLEPEDQFGFQRDDQVVALDEKGEIKYHEAIVKY